MGRFPDLLQSLSRGEPIHAPVAVVAAHPDDETLGLGSRLGCMRQLTLVHLTDGAPRGPAGTEYRKARRCELRSAMEAAGASGAQCLYYGYPDQEAIRYCDAILRRLAEDIAGARTVFTHPYEHGHPDHDTAALAVALACATLRERGAGAPEHYEFASYHLRHGTPAYGVFWPDPEARETVIALSPHELERKRAITACFVSQRTVIDRFPLAEERVRRTPRYDFCQPAPPGAALYDSWGWTMTSGLWRARAARTVSRAAIRRRPCR